ncbi:MAG: tetratricopeptide repeat protein [Nitrospirota bacterium]
MQENTGSPEKPEKVDELYMRGRDAYEGGDFALAERCFTEVVQKSPYADVYNKLGLIYHGKGELGKAVAAFRKALELNPGYTEVSLNLAVTLNDMGKYNEAGEVFGKAAKIAHDAPYTIDPYIKGKLANEHAKLGDIYYDMGLFGEAVEEYKKAINLRPTFVDIITKIGIAYREKGMYNEAIREFMKSKEINPKYIPARINLGITYYMKGFIDLAVTEWTGALDVSPDNTDAQMYLKFIQSEQAGGETLGDLESL